MSRGSTLSRMVARARDLNPHGPIARARIKKAMPAIVKRLAKAGHIKPKSKGLLSKFNPFNRGS